MVQGTVLLNGGDRKHGWAVPLRVHVLFHPDSGAGRALAKHLYDVLSGPGHDWGIRIPVRFTPRTDPGAGPPPFEPEADHALVVALMDARMSRRASDDERREAAAWGRHLADLVERFSPDCPGPHSFLPVALDDGAFKLSDAFRERSFVRLDRAELSALSPCRHLTLHVAIRALRLLKEERASDRHDANRLPSTTVELFLSHASRDRQPQEHGGPVGPVAALRDAASALSIQPWVDAAAIPAGGRFPDEIDSGILRSSALVSVLTDGYSAREWCRRELFDAKEASRPVVVVDAIQSRVVRLFPYIGNAPTVRWRAALAEDEFEVMGTAEAAAVRRRWEAEDARTVIELTLLEALRYEHELRRLRRRLEAGVVVLGTHPEAVTVAALPTNTTKVIYPDPPLGGDEARRVMRTRPEVELSTALSELVKWPPPEALGMVGVSLSGSPDSDRYGASREHLATMAHDLVLYLLLAGVRIGYGGVLGHGALDAVGRAPGDDIPYVERLFDLVARYSPLASDLGRPGLRPIENWVAWPMYLGFNNQERNRYNGSEASLEEVSRPFDSSLNDAELEPDFRGFFPPNTPARRYAWSRSLTEMRTRMIAASSARITLGGKLTDFVGQLPGVFEEALLALRARQPVYVLGAFGGAARLLVDVLEGQERDELSSAWYAAHHEGWTDLIEEYRRRDAPMESIEEAADELRQLGETGLDIALANGLDPDENRELFRTDDPHRAVVLVLQGLQAVWSSQ